MWYILAASCYWQAIAVVLNLLPIPGLDGYGALEPWLPPEAQEWGRRFKPYGFFLLVILFIASSGFNRAFSGAVVIAIRTRLQVNRGPRSDEGFEAHADLRRPQLDASGLPAPSPIRISCSLPAGKRAEGLASSRPATGP